MVIVVHIQKQSVFVKKFFSKMAVVSEKLLLIIIICSILNRCHLCSNVRPKVN